LIIKETDFEIDGMINKRNNKKYLCLNIDDIENSRIYARELRAIERVFNFNRKYLERFFSPEEIYQLKNNFEERARLWYEVRKQGKKLNLTTINQLKSLETSRKAQQKLDSLAYDLVYGKMARDNEILLDQIRFKSNETREETKLTIPNYLLRDYINQMESSKEDPEIEQIVILPQDNKGKARQDEQRQRQQREEHKQREQHEQVR